MVEHALALLFSPLRFFEYEEEKRCPEGKRWLCRCILDQNGNIIDIVVAHYQEESYRATIRWKPPFHRHLTFRRRPMMYILTLKNRIVLILYCI